MRLVNNLKKATKEGMGKWEIFLIYFFKKKQIKNQYNTKDKNGQNIENSQGIQKITKNMQNVEQIRKI